jgi:hypothetical protein
MPIYPPRTEPVKKQEELLKRETELIFAIERNDSLDKLNKCVEKYRKANLSLLKAKVHQFKENEYQKKENKISLEKLEEMKNEWTEKTIEKIIYEVKKSNTN